jgi:metallo-beta-lactamase class B
MKWKESFMILIMILSVALVACTKSDGYAYQFTDKNNVEISSDLTAKLVVEGVMLVNHEFPWGANSLVIEMSNSDVVLIDTPYTYDATKELVEWIKSEVGDERTIVAINTGFHFDNLGGNGYLIEQGYKVYSTSQTVDMIYERGESSREWFLEHVKSFSDKKYYETYQNLAYVEESDVFTLMNDQELKLDFGHESLYLYYPGLSHSPDNIVVYYPDKGVLFGGCMIKELSATDLGNTIDANISEWTESILKLMDKYNEEMVKYLIPGHGEMGTILLLDKTLALLLQK